ncbi:MAG: HU family DNA-binding protein [Muribaculaceae bacterium]|nr:HU family DNA-binding protein [Muribaculaceae bacterium]
MDNSTFTSRLSKRIGRSVAETSRLADALTDVIRQAATDLDSVAVPSFGSFVPVKEEETVITDRSSGKRILLPPSVSITFRPASFLVRRLK